MFKLTFEDKELLRTWGYEDREFKQIENCANNGEYFHLKGNRSYAICLKTALKKLGCKKFLSGLSRSAFHWSAVREYNDYKVLFDMGKYLNR